MKHKSPDTLEQIVSRCREDIDVDYDVAKGWSVLEGRISTPAVETKQTTAKVLPMWSRISAIAAVLVLGIIVGRFTVPALQENQISPIAEIKTHYDQEVNKQITLVKAYEPNHAIIEEIKLLDEQIGVLEADYKKANDMQREFILESMISNYQSRVYLLQNILNKLNTHSNEKFTEI